jgi:hypothetical protein
MGPFDTQTTPLRNFEIAAASCFLRYEAEVINAELHAIHDGLLYLDASDIVPQDLFICINNSAAITTLQENPKNLSLHETHPKLPTHSQKRMEHLYNLDTSAPRHKRK